MIRSVLRLTPREGCDRDVLAFYERRGILDRALTDGGCASVHLEVRLPGRDEVVVSALWDSAADYDAWVASADRAVDARALEDLLDPSSLPLGPGDVYEVASCAGKDC